jgi:hypothetical protein
MLGPAALAACFEVRMVMAEGHTEEEWKSKYPTRWGETIIGTTQDGDLRVEINIPFWMWVG